MIRCFHQLDFIKITDKIESSNVKWRTAKSKDIFAYLLHHQNCKVGKYTLIEIHWPSIGDREAYARLYTAIYYIRAKINTMKLPIELINTTQGYELKLKDILIDVEKY